MQPWPIADLGAVRAALVNTLQTGYRPVYSKGTTGVLELHASAGKVVPFTPVVQGFVDEGVVRQ